MELYARKKKRADWARQNKWRTALDLSKKIVTGKLFNEFEEAGYRFDPAAILSATKSLIDAFNISARAEMKLVIGKERHIPGLVPVQAEIGDLIALMPNSNVPIILRPTSDGCARFVGETFIYIYGAPVEASGSKQEFPIARNVFQYFETDLPHGEKEDWVNWDKSDDVWWPIGFTKRENWQPVFIH